MIDRSKPILLHFIYSLGRGGAETMVVRTIKELPEYSHVVVTLIPDDHFGEELVCDAKICLNMKGLAGLPKMISAFSRLTREIAPSIVHTHLFWPTFIARFAVPKNIPLVTTIHAFIKTSVEYRHWYIRFLDRISYRRRNSFIIVVARGALEEYFEFLRKPIRDAKVLYTFVDVKRFTGNKRRNEGPGFRLIAVGALRVQKNYDYIIKAMALLREHPISLDIYGTGQLHKEIQEQIDKSKAKVCLKGEVRDIEERMQDYDLFVMSSTFEGFSLGVLEAMAMGMPLLLSDISSFREQCGDLAWYFNLDDPKSAADRILVLSKTPANILSERGTGGRERVLQHFTLEHHIQQLRNIYIEVLEESSPVA